MTVMSFSSMPLVAALLAAAAPTVWGHGYMGTPLARQLCNGKATQFSLVVAAGNGARGLKPNGGNPLGGMPGLCGDPFEARLSNPPSNVEGLPCEPQVRTHRSTRMPAGLPACLRAEGLSTGVEDEPAWIDCLPVTRLVA